MILTDVLKALGIEFRPAGSHHHVTSGWVGIDCPYCSPGSGKYRLGIRESGRYATCWVCGYRPLVQVLEQSAKTGARRDVRSLLGQILNQRGERPAERKIGGFLDVPKCVGPLQPAHRRYLESRNLNPDTVVNVWGVKGIGVDGGRLAWRLWIPVHRRGEVVSWTTRAITSSDRRYVTAGKKQEKEPAKGLLYGADHARHAVVVCEGPVDVWRIGPGAVALLGVGFSRAQVASLSRYPRRIIAFDCDKAGRKKAQELADLLAPFPGDTFIAHLSAGDVATAPRQEVRILRKFLRGKTGDG